MLPHYLKLPFPLFISPHTRCTWQNTHLEALAGGVDLDRDIRTVGGRGLVRVLASIEAAGGQLIAIGAGQLELGACKFEKNMV